MDVSEDGFDLATAEVREKDPFEKENISKLLIF